MSPIMWFDLAVRAYEFVRGEVNGCKQAKREEVERSRAHGHAAGRAAYEASKNAGP